MLVYYGKMRDTCVLFRMIRINCCLKYGNYTSLLPLTAQYRWSQFLCRHYEYPVPMPKLKWENFIHSSPRKLCVLSVKSNVYRTNTCRYFNTSLLVLSIFVTNPVRRCGSYLYTCSVHWMSAKNRFYWTLVDV